MRGFYWRPAKKKTPRQCGRAFQLSVCDYRAGAAGAGFAGGPAWRAASPAGPVSSEAARAWRGERLLLAGGATAGGGGAVISAGGEITVPDVSLVCQLADARNRPQRARPAPARPRGWSCSGCGRRCPACRGSHRHGCRDSHKCFSRPRGFSFMSFPSRQHCFSRRCRTRADNPGRRVMVPAESKCPFPATIRSFWPVGRNRSRACPRSMVGARVRGLLQPKEFAMKRACRSSRALFHVGSHRLYHQRQGALFGGLIGAAVGGSCDQFRSWSSLWRRRGRSGRCNSGGVAQGLCTYRYKGRTYRERCR